MSVQLHCIFGTILYIILNIFQYILSMCINMYGDKRHRTHEKVLFFNSRVGGFFRLSVFLLSLLNMLMLVEGVDIWYAIVWLKYQ